MYAFARYFLKGIVIYFTGDILGFVCKRKSSFNLMVKSYDTNTLLVATKHIIQIKVKKR